MNSCVKNNKYIPTPEESYVYRNRESMAHHPTPAESYVKVE